MKGEIDDLEKEINILKDELSKKVNADGIINAINISPETTRIKGSKIKVDNETMIENNVINPGMVNLKGISESVERHIAKSAKNRRAYK